MDARWLIAAPLVVASVAALAAAEEATGSGPACATVRAGVRMQAYGYAHVVTLANRCQRAVSCEVWTNVDPLPRYTLQAKPGESVEVITRNGSPAREVQAGKRCGFVQGG